MTETEEYQKRLIVELRKRNKIFLDWLDSVIAHSEEERDKKTGKTWRAYYQGRFDAYWKAKDSFNYFQVMELE